MGSIPIRIAKHIIEGKRLIDNGQCIEAITVLEEAIRLEPTSSFPYAFKGMALVLTDRKSEAIIALKQAIHLDPNDVIVQEILHTVNPPDPKSYITEGVDLYNRGHHARALALFDEALRLDPHDTEAHGLKGGALYELGRYAEAIVALDVAIKLDPGNEDLQALRRSAVQLLRR